MTNYTQREKNIFKRVIEEFERLEKEVNKLQEKGYSLQEACDFFGGHNFRDDEFFDLNTTGFCATIRLVDGKLTLDNKSLEVWDDEQEEMINDFTLDKLKEIVNGKDVVMRELKTLEVDRWAPSEKKGMVKHVGMISPQEAFDALKEHLKSVDLMPDEYFNSNAWSWKDEKELPEYLQANCNVHWGHSEGIYLDIALLYHDETGELQQFNFATGKTLGNTGDDYLRMSRIASECSMMLNGRGKTVRFYEEEQSLGSKKERTVVNNLIQAMADYAMENDWLDSEMIDALVDCGITEDDFKNNGYGDFVKEYFENSINKYAKDLSVTKWQLDCELSDLDRAMTVQIGYSISDVYGVYKDETEFCIEAYNELELAELFRDFIKENIKEDYREDVLIDYVSIVKTAPSMEELVALEEAEARGFDAVINDAADKSAQQELIGNINTKFDREDR